MEEAEKREQERRAKLEKDKFEKGVAAEKARVLKAQKEAEGKEELDRKRRETEAEVARRSAAALAKERGNEVEVERLRRLGTLKQKQKEREKNKMLTMGGDYSHHEHDVAGLWRGARVVNDDRVVHGVQLTSPWKHHGQSIFAPAIAWIRHTAPPVNKLYSAQHPPTDYFSFAGPAGTLTLFFFTHVHLREVRIYHPFSDAQRAPKDFRVLGWEQNPANRRFRQLEPSVLGHFRYVPTKGREMQYFELMRHKQKSSYAAVTIDISSNYHHEQSSHKDPTAEENWTNLWRLQIIGHEVNQVAVA